MTAEVARLPTNSGLRTPPHNVEIEQALLGAILRNDKALDRVADMMAPEFFYAPEHQRLYHHIVQTFQAGQHPSPTRLSHIAESDEILKEAGGTEYLYRLSANVVTVINAADYARTIHDLFLKRQLIAVGEDMVNDSYDNDDIDFTADKQIEAVEQKLHDLLAFNDSQRASVSLGKAARQAVEMADAAYRNDGKVVGLSTGIVDIDNALGGLVKSDFLVIGGRPAMGKTALACVIAYNVAKTIDPAQGKVLFGSLEMSASQLAARILARLARLDSERVRKGYFTPEEFQRYEQCARDLEALPLEIDDNTDTNIARLRQKARRVKRQHGLQLVIVDYLQLLDGSKTRKNENRTNEIGEISRGLKKLAKELDVPVIALSQLSRAVENREDKRPRLADLREGGSIEQDADGIAFCYREYEYLKADEPQHKPGDDTYHDRHAKWLDRMNATEHLFEFLIAKNRHGQTRNIKLYCDLSTMTITDLDKREGV